MEVKKIGNIPYKEFINEFYKPGIPVVFKEASKRWKANGLFTPNYFRANFGDRKTEVKEKEYSMNQLLDLIESSTESNPAPYPCIFDIPRQLPEILPLISPIEMLYAEPNWFNSKFFPSVVVGSNVELFLGSPGGKFPVAHIDYYHTNAWITQLYGRKNFIVFPRDQDEFMYAKKDNKWESEVNIFNPDYEKHPKFKQATPVTITVEQGETIFIPAGLWHSAESLSPSISVIFDQINSRNFDQYVSDVWDVKKKQNMLKAIAVLAYCRTIKYFCLLSDFFTKPQ